MDNVRNKNNYTSSDIHNNSCTPVVFKIPGYTMTYSCTALACEIAIVNSVVLPIFLKQKHRSPMTILLASLAIADGVTAILISLPYFVIIMLQPTTLVNLGKYFEWHPAYPLCIVFNLSLVVGFSFHQASVLLTTALSVQKTLAVQCPLWSRTHLNNKMAMVTSLLLFGFSLLSRSLHIVYPLEQYQDIDGVCCVQFKRKYSIDPAIIVINIVSVTMVFVCTALISCKLACFRKTLKWVDSPAVAKRNQRSAIVVICICVIFIFSEGPNLVYIISQFIGIYFADFQSSRDDILNELVPYLELSMLVGFSLNFIIYLFAGNRLRQVFMKGLCGTCGRCPCRK